MIITRKTEMAAVLNVGYKVATNAKRHLQFAIKFHLAPIKIWHNFSQRINHNHAKTIGHLPSILKCLAPSRPTTTKSSSRWTHSPLSASPIKKLWRLSWRPSSQDALLPLSSAPSRPTKRISSTACCSSPQVSPINLSLQISHTHISLNQEAVRWMSTL